MHALKVHEFDVELDVRDITDDLVDMVFEAGCDDALLCKDDRTVYLSFEREGRSRNRVVAATLNALHKVGLPLVAEPELRAAN